MDRRSDGRRGGGGGGRWYWILLLLLLLLLYVRGVYGGEQNSRLKTMEIDMEAG